MSLDCGRKPEFPGEMHTGTGRTLGIPIRYLLALRQQYYYLQQPPLLGEEPPLSDRRSMDKWKGYPEPPVDLRRQCGIGVPAAGRRADRGPSRGCSWTAAGPGSEAPYQRAPCDRQRHTGAPTQFLLPQYTKTIHLATTKHTVLMYTRATQL